MDDEHVLLVDDVPDVREVLSLALELEGYNVLQAGAGDEAVELAAEHEPFVIIMDMQMPVMDGIEATLRIKEDRGLRHIPVVAHTAFASDIPSKDLFTAVLPKPCSPDHVLGTIARFRRKSTD